METGAVSARAYEAPGRSSNSKPHMPPLDSPHALPDDQLVGWLDQWGTGR